MKSFALPKSRMLSTKGMNIDQLLRHTDALRKSGSGDTVIKDLKYVKTGNGLLVVKAKMSSASRANKVFDTWLTFTDVKDRRNINAKSKIMAQCSCEDYMFMWEYANTAHNAARIFYGNGDAPDERNPAQHPGLCKHCYKLAEHSLH